MWVAPMTVVPKSNDLPAQEPPVPVASGTIRKTLVLKNRRGLHCRPAALLIKTQAAFRSTVMVEANDTRANGRSILGLMTLSAAYGARLTFTVTGLDAAETMAAIQGLFNNNFAQAYESE